MKTIFLFSILALLAGCASTFTPVNECPLLGVATGEPNCHVEFWGNGGESGDSDAGDNEAEE